MGKRRNYLEAREKLLAMHKDGTLGNVTTRLELARMVGYGPGEEKKAQSWANQMVRRGRIKDSIILDADGTPRHKFSLGDNILGIRSGKLIDEYPNEEERAREIILQAISDYRTRLEAFTLTDKDDLDPVMVDGETRTGYYCQMLVNPKEVAEIVLKYDYPVFAVLKEEPPRAMWAELADHFGLDSVSSIDL